METDTSTIIVETGATAGTWSVHHRDFSEIRCEGSAPKVAAEHLKNQLIRALDSALTNWRRETIQKAINDVQAFIDKVV